MNKKRFTYVFLKPKKNFSLVIASFGSIIALSSLLKFRFRKIHDENEPQEDEENGSDSRFKFKNVIEDHFKGKIYITKPNVENLALMAKLSYCLTCIKIANRTKTQANRERVVSELEKMNDISDIIAQMISNLIDDELMLELSSNPKINNRFIRMEPPSIHKKIVEYDNLRSSQQATQVESIEEDDDFAFIFDFYRNKLDLLKKIEKVDKNIKNLVEKFIGKINLLLKLEREKHNNSINPLHENIDYNELIQMHLKNTKYKFIFSIEYLMLKLLDSIAQFSINEFLNIGGLELLLQLYEKYKMNIKFLTEISDVLCLVSIQSTNTLKLFVHSGWLKRLHEMLVRSNEVNLLQSTDSFSKLEEDKLTLKLIVLKILHNLNLRLENKNPPEEADIYYSTMVYPLYPLTKDEEAIHKKDIDVIFIHGLMGSVFKTWRQDDNFYKSIFEKLPLAENYHNVSESQLVEKFKAVIDTSSTLIPNLIHYVKYTNCWPKDWLSKDCPNCRILGINYISLLSYWTDEIYFDDNTIKYKADEIRRQLKQANVGERPIVWVCHSMGGLILKQILTDINNEKADSSIVKNTRGMVFYSTPHFGSPLAKNALKIRIATWPSKEVDELALDNQYLIDLNEKFLKLMKNSDSKIISFCENLKTYVGYLPNLNVKLVPEYSANIGIGEFYLLDKDHLYICKPESKESILYSSLVKLIEEIYEKYVPKVDQFPTEPFENWIDYQILTEISTF